MTELRAGEQVTLDSDGSPTTKPPAGGARRTWLFDAGERYGLVVAWVAVIVLFAILAPTTFPTRANFDTIFGTQAVLLVLTIGLIVPLSVGEYDLSIGGVMGLSTIFVAYLQVQQHWPVMLAVVVALAAGVAIGAINAFFVVGVGLSSFVTTLGMGTLLTGVGYGLTNSTTIGGISSGFVQAITYQIGGLPIAFFIGLLLTIVAWYVLQYTPLGRHLVFVGEGREVARLTGLPVGRIRAGSLVVCSLLAAGAGVLQAGVVGAADPGGGASYLLPAFAAAFLGATSIRPGRFNAWGAFIAVYFLVTGISGLELMGISGWVQDVFYGGSLVIAVAFARVAARRRNAMA